jgi:uncharacterized membrane protein
LASPLTAGPNVRHAQARALAKAVSWRLLGTIGTSTLVYLFTGRWDLALTIGGAEGVAKIGLYFIHERLWDRVAYGRDSEKEPRG